MATLPAPADAVAGAAATSSGANTWRDGLKFLLGISNTAYGQKPFALMRQTVAQALVTSTWTSITLDTEDVDYDSGHSTTTNTSRYTANLAGWHLVVGAVGFAASGTGARQTRLAVNGTAVVASAGAQLLTLSASVAANLPTAPRFVYLNLADYVEVQGWQSAGANLNTAVGSEVESFLGVTWISS